MGFLLGIGLGLLVGIGLTQLVVTRRQRANWETAIAERRLAERRSHELSQRISALSAAHRAELRSIRSLTDKEASHHRYLLQRADSALAAAREARDLQSAELEALRANHAIGA